MRSRCVLAGAMPRSRPAGTKAALAEGSGAAALDCQLAARREPWTGRTRLEEHGVCAPAVACVQAKKSAKSSAEGNVNRFNPAMFPLAGQAQDPGNSCTWSQRVLAVPGRESARKRPRTGCRCTKYNAFGPDSTPQNGSAGTLQNMQKGTSFRGLLALFGTEGQIETNSGRGEPIVIGWAAGRDSWLVVRGSWVVGRS